MFLEYNRHYFYAKQKVKNENFRIFLVGGSVIIMKQTFSLKKNKEFKHIYKKGKSYANRLLVIYYLPNEKNYNRLGLSVSKKVGNSVIRNRVKRLLRESYRLNEENIKTAYDIVIIARVQSDKADFKSIDQAVIHLMKRVKLWI